MDSNQAYEVQKITALATASSNIIDYGPLPMVINIETATTENTHYRAALWTGTYLQLTLMSIEPGADIGLEMHPDLDQFIRIEAGKGYVKMGPSEDNLDFSATVYEDCAILIPAGMWHNLINTGKEAIKLYSIYAPPQHPFSTIHKTREEAAEAEEDAHH